MEIIFAGPHEDILRYVDDPLWPMFKYPLSENERTRVLNNVRIRLRSLERIAENITQKLLNDVDSQLIRRRIIRHIVSVASQIPYEVVHIRLPKYPGVSCRQSVVTGLHVNINVDYYDNPDEAHDIFEKMMYFYLGHRLEEIVKRERELAMSSKEGLKGGE
jgi:hypothetical protein